MNLVALGTLSGMTDSPLRAEQPDAVDFDQVRPILAEACFKCHGPDEQQRQANLRLDDPENVLSDEDRAILVAGKPEESELYKRITSEDERRVMPPPTEARRLAPEEIELLRRWIAEGPASGTHWAFLPPGRPDPPVVTLAEWPRNEIDSFILARLENEGLQPVPEADRRTLIRRVSLDLTGLPPTPKEVEAFLGDDAPDAYERLVDRLLASSGYGERMATVWLDGARYADSGGYQGDIPRTMWPWRDWVIDAYNDNMPFDQFTVEQLAGDLLPRPTADQLIATGFNRNHRINDEDGIIHEEFRVEYVVDRVETTSTVWMGLTMGCARCHDHKYDPVSQEEFYRFFAYFNNVDETGRGYGNTQPLFYFDPYVRPRIEEIDQRLLELGDAAQGEYEEILKLKKERDEILDGCLTSMIMQERDEPRQTYVLDRGLYDQRGDPVGPGVPSTLPAFPENAPENRLGLAHWLLDPEHPLTARVAVNRYWQMRFGTGLVETPEDFGLRGERPSHPLLLDWLASEFVRSGWNVKGMQRLIVTSATYRQSSRVCAERFQRDPDNRLLSRGPRLRLSAETIRDQALAAAGLLDDRVGGPSVKPYQPPGIWKEMVSFFPDYEQSEGDDLYRRSLYTFIRRTVPPPAMIVFDAPSREICTVKRARTNTPLQSLVTMNDPTYVEAARVLAQHQMIAAADEDWIRAAFERVLSRPPEAPERRLLNSQYEYHRREAETSPEKAAGLISVGEYPLTGGLDAAELAARTAVISLILNLDETFNRE